MSVRSRPRSKSHRPDRNHRISTKIRSGLIDATSAASSPEEQILPQDQVISPKKRNWGHGLTRLLYGSYAGVLIALVGGSLAMPGVFFSYPHHGISFWGNYFPAIIPYSIGFTVTAACMLYAAYVLPGRPEHLAAMRRLLAALAFGLVLVLLTPDEASLIIYWVHMSAAVYLFVVAGIGAIWIMLRDGARSRADRLLFWAFVAGSILSLLSVSFVSVLGVLALGQVLALNAGMLIIVRATLRWADQEIREGESSVRRS